MDNIPLEYKLTVLVTTGINKMGNTTNTMFALESHKSMSTRFGIDADGTAQPHTLAKFMNPHSQMNFVRLPQDHLVTVERNSNSTEKRNSRDAHL